MDYEKIIEKVMSGYAVRGKSYPAPIPAELQNWYCYTVDGGHSILCVLIGDFNENENGFDVEDDMLPVPVKAVLRGYEIKNDYVVVDLQYSPETGLEVDESDEEF